MLFSSPQIDYFIIDIVVVLALPMCMKTFLHDKRDCITDFEDRIFNN